MNIEIPKQIGFYCGCDGELRIFLTKKPNLWHRFWTNFFLGFEWNDFNG